MRVPVNAFIADDVPSQRDQFLRVNNTRPLPRGLITELLPEVIEETLRWETSVTMVSRVATVDTEIAGCPVTAGSPVNVLTGSAAYGIGYLSVKYLVTTYGNDKMLAFWGDVERKGDTVDAAAQKEFNTPWSSVNTACASCVWRCSARCTCSVRSSSAPWCRATCPGACSGSSWSVARS